LEPHDEYLLNDWFNNKNHDAFCKNDTVILLARFIQLAVEFTPWQSSIHQADVMNTIQFIPATTLI